MKPKELLLGQSQDEVEATMQEENCSKCFGCPNATILSAELSHRADLLLRFTFEARISDSEHHESIEKEVKEKHAELSALTSSCEGYYDKRTKGALRPAKMCNSSEYSYHPVQIAAGKVLELFNL